VEERILKKADFNHVLEALDYVQKRVGDKMFILGSADVSFPASTSWLSLFMEAMVLEPKLVKRYLDAKLEITLNSLQPQIKKGIDGVIGGVDWASRREMLFSPAHFRKYILPRLKIITAECHKHGLPYIKHTDGNVKAVEKEFLVESGIDGCHAIEPVAGMDIEELKKKYGERITLLGNVDCSKTLVYGKKEDIVNEVKQCISKAASGGGYVLSSNNSIHSQVPVENFLIMLIAARKYGKYPINLTGEAR
jgi:uroporphyrinogen decarboxylase